MPTHAESNACNACARSKRKCGRQLPSCARCVDRGSSCVYPMSRRKGAPSSRPLLSYPLRSSLPGVEDRLLDELMDNASAHTLADDLVLDLALPLIDNNFNALSSHNQAPTAPATRPEWFLTPETWRISRRVETSIDAAVGIATMKKYVVLLQSWFEGWVTTGSNPFIHAHLYSTNFPVCLQVAYSTLASYIHRTPANIDIVLQIVEDRSTDLLHENGAVLDAVGAEQWADARDQDVDLFAQLTRLHALMVYQLIGLFDGDIRSRHIAEGRMAIQNSWAHKLFHSAAKALSNTQAAATHIVGCLPTPSTSSQQHWYLWILAESIRRTWLIAVSLSSVYTALQRGWSTCPGGIMYTNRIGLWKAVNAAEWEKQCFESNVAFLQRFECATLLDDAAPAEIDEFGMAMLDMTFNEELLERWRDRSSGL